MILSDGSLMDLLPRLLPDHRDVSLVNPASVDIRVGRALLAEASRGGETFFGPPSWIRVSLPETLQGDTAPEDDPYWLKPQEFVLVETYERIVVPNGYAVELKLKSSRAREGYDHSLAFWFDPGWDGIGTLEIRNVTRWSRLPLYCGLRLGQIIVHELDRWAVTPYRGRYNGATAVEGSKG